MPADTVKAPRSVPKPVFTDAEAGAKEFPSSRSRSYNYFEPRSAARRSTRTSPSTSSPIPSAT